VRLHYLMAALAAAVFVSEVRAQANCGDRTAIVARLFESYGEVKAAEGVLAGGSAIVEIFSNRRRARRAVASPRLSPIPMAAPASLPRAIAGAMSATGDRGYE